jgi:hypothetical protein
MQTRDVSFLLSVFMSDLLPELAGCRVAQTELDTAPMETREVPFLLSAFYFPYL